MKIVDLTDFNNIHLTLQADKYALFDESGNLIATTNNPEGTSIGGKNESN